MKNNFGQRRGRTVLAAACALLLAPLLAAGEPVTFEVTLTGPSASGDPDGRGQATVTLNGETNEVEVRLTHSNIAEPTMMHIRKAETGRYGNVEVPIEIRANQGGTVEGYRESAMPGIVARILASPSEHYLVVINDEHPVGALRGPLSE